MQGKKERLLYILCILEPEGQNRGNTRSILGDGETGKDGHTPETKQAYIWTKF